MADSNAGLVRPPLVLREVPVRISAAAGFVYYLGSFIMLQSAGELHAYLPLVGITTALGVFVYRTARLVGNQVYRRRLLAYERRGLIVFVPPALLSQAKDARFGADLQKTSTLVKLHKDEGYSPKVQAMLRSLN